MTSWTPETKNTSTFTNEENRAKGPAAKYGTAKFGRSKYGKRHTVDRQDYTNETKH